MISFEVVTQTWQRISQIPPERAPVLVEQMQNEQPVVLNFLVSLDELPFNYCERESIFYIGLVTWQIMKQSERVLQEVTVEKIRQAEDKNLELLERLINGDVNEFVAAVQHLISNHAEPQVLRYIVEAIMEENEAEPGFRAENTGLAFIHLKIMLDALISCLGPQADLVA
jgi:hypothetical protein